MKTANRLLSSDSRYVIVVLTPIVLLIALFIYYPAVETFNTSLTNRNLRIRRPPKAIGLDNYVRLVNDDEFREVTGRSFKVVLITLPLEMAVAFGVAMLLNQRFPGRGAVRTLAILPWMLPGVVNGFLWGWLLNGEYGALNGFLYQFGLDQRVSVLAARARSSVVVGLRRADLDALCLPDDHLAGWLAEHPG